MTEQFMANMFWVNLAFKEPILRKTNRKGLTGRLTKSQSTFEIQINGHQTERLTYRETAS